MIKPDRLNRYLEDYFAATGEPTNEFVCPITLTRVHKQDLIDGHILNRAIKSASRKTVLQNRDVDNFFGTVVEPSFIEFLNNPISKTVDIVKRSRHVRVVLSDGSRVKAFHAKSRSGQKAAGRYPCAEFLIDGESIGLFLRAERSELEGGVPVGVEITLNYYPAHWLASMLKSAYLAVFSVLGYLGVNNALADTIRSAMSNYFRDKGGRLETERYFSEFSGSCKLLGFGEIPTDLEQDYQPISFDSLEDNRFIFHYINDQFLFAISVIFRINGKTLAATIPQTLDHCDSGIAWQAYRRFLEMDDGLNRTSRLAEFTGSSWNVEENGTRCHIC